MLHSDKKLSYPYRHFHYDFNLFLDITYCQNFASLGTSTSYMVNITFPLVDLAESTELTRHCQMHSYLLWICPWKILLFIISLKNQKPYTSCLTIGNNNDI